MGKAGLSAVLSVALLGALGCQGKSKAAKTAMGLPAQTQPLTAEQTPPVSPEQVPARTGEVVLAPAPALGPTEIPSSIPPWQPTQITMRVTPTGGLRREWNPAAAYRPSGDVLAWPLYYEDVGNRAKWPDWQAPFIEPALFLANTGLLPVNMVLTPPWRKVVYSDATDTTWTPNPPADVEPTNGQP
ncbi:MAG TPA: hypothetical protein VHP11_13145 [Tepidisphaeraceae bacterium]|nr:hypothetical protein [Tepidisphaeraceae bacterium]